MRIYFRSLAEFAIEAVFVVRTALVGKPDADALAAAACPDLIEPPDDTTAAIRAELDLTYQAITTARVGMTADLRIGTGLADEDLAEWDRELAYGEWQG